MAKKTPLNVESGYASTIQLDAEFEEISDHFNDLVLYRDNPNGEPNQMENDLDMNSNSILNISSPNSPTDVTTKSYVDSLLTGTEDTGSAQLRADLASSTNGEGASLIGIEDSGANFTATDVEGALSELAVSGSVTISIVDSANNYTGSTLEDVVAEIADIMRSNSFAVAPPTDTGIANAYVLTTVQDVLTLGTGDLYTFVVSNTSTSSSTLNVNTLGVKNIKRELGEALVAGDLLVGETVTVKYDGTEFLLQGDNNPTGTILTLLTDRVPNGYLHLDGDATLSTTTYARLFSIIGYKYQVTQSGLTFTIPDTRGYFFRNWSDTRATIDPDKATRTDRGDGTVGDNVGTLQEDELESHNHSNAANNVAQGNFGWAPAGGGDFGPRAWSSTGGNETRSKNMYVMTCIRY